MARADAVPPLGSTGPASRLPSCDQLMGLKRSSALNGGSGGGSLTGVFFRSMTNQVKYPDAMRAPSGDQTGMPGFPVDVVSRVSSLPSDRIVQSSYTPERSEQNPLREP